MMRMEESAADEEEFWRINTFKRIARDWSQFWETNAAVKARFSLCGSFCLCMLVWAREVILQGAWH